MSGRSTACCATSRSCSCDAWRPSPARSGSILSCRRVSSRPKTPAMSSASPKRNTDIAFQAMVELQRKVADLVRKPIRRLPTSIRRSAPAVPIRSPTAAACWSRLSRDERGSSPAGARAAAAKPPTSSPASRSSSSLSRTSISAASCRRASTNTRCSPTTPTSSTDSRRKCATRSRSSGRCSTSPPTSTSRIRR